MSQQRKRSRIILIGDSCKDVSHFGHVNRLSPEGPFPVLDYHSTEVADGMIMNVYNNFMNLLMRPDDITLYSKLCEEKIRYFDDVSQRQLMRMDKPILDDIQAYDLTGLLLADISDFDAIVISDYNKGYVTYDFVESLRKKYDGPIFIDTKKPDLARFKGCIVKINRHEWNSRISDDSDSAYVITGGGEDVTIRFAGTTHEAYVKPPHVEAHDPCGCGDTFLASFVYDYLETQNIMRSTEFAVKAAAITVTRTGVYAPTLEEITGEDYTYH